MSRWFRHYAGMMRDDKLVSAAIKAKQPVERVVWVWGAILESAAEIDDGGRFSLDAAEVAYFLRADEADISVVMAALVAMGRVSDDRVVKWSDRQFTSDRSADRQAKYRERKRAETRGGDENKASSDAVVTSPSRHGDAPEAETDTELEKEQQTRAWPVDRIIEAASSNGGCQPSLVTSVGQILAYRDKGYDLDRDILPVIRSKASPSVGSWRYFGKIIEANALQQSQIAVKPAPPDEDWPGRMKVWAEGTWVHGWGPEPGAPGCRVPPELLSRAA